MKIAEAALQEYTPLISRIFFIRLVRCVSSYSRGECYAIFGVPFWRDLRYSDLCKKFVIEIR